jgi:hypothetical protein
MTTTYPILITVGSILEFYGRHALVVAREFVGGTLYLKLRTGTSDEVLEVPGALAAAKMTVKFLAII